MFTPTTVPDQLKRIFRSRKFWALLLSLLATISAHFLGELDIWQALQAVVASFAVYSTGIAIEDAGFKIGKGGSRANY